MQDTVNTSTHITKTSTHYKIPTYTHPHITKQVKTTTVQDIPKWNSHNTIKYSQYKVTLMYMTLLSPRISLLILQYFNTFNFTFDTPSVSVQLTFHAVVP